MITSAAFSDKTFNHNAVLDETDKYFLTLCSVFNLGQRRHFTVFRFPSSSQRQTPFLCPTGVYPQSLTQCWWSVMHIYLYISTTNIKITDQTNTIWYGTVWLLFLPLAMFIRRVSLFVCFWYVGRITAPVGKNKCPDFPPVSTHSIWRN